MNLFSIQIFRNRINLSEFQKRVRPIIGPAILIALQYIIYYAQKLGLNSHHRFCLNRIFFLRVNVQ